MARTTTREIIRVCADLARMDKKAKLEVMQYLHDELKRSIPEPEAKDPVAYKFSITEGGES